MFDVYNDIASGAGLYFKKKCTNKNLRNCMTSIFGCGTYMNEEGKQMMSYEFNCWSHTLTAKIIEHMNNAEKEMPDPAPYNFLGHTFAALKP